MGIPIALSTMADEASFEISSLIIGILKVIFKLYIYYFGILKSFSLLKY